MKIQSINIENIKSMEKVQEISLSQIEGIKIGHAQNIEGGTGCTAIICEDGATASVEIRGSAPATRETDLLEPTKTVEKIHCLMLSGGSAYGLEAGSGAMEFLEEKGIGLDVGCGIVPIVCGASLFDLVVGDPKCRPDKAMGRKACENALREEGDNESPSSVNVCQADLQGNVGAGTGASIGKCLGPDRMMKSGLGTYAVKVGDIVCGAVVAVNALGDVVDRESGEIIGGLLTEDKKSLANTTKLMIENINMENQGLTTNTTIGCIITNAKLTKVEAKKIAQVAHNGYAKAISPVHTSIDGDGIFVMATGKADCTLDNLGKLAEEVMAEAIKSAVRNAKGAYGLVGRGE